MKKVSVLTVLLFVLVSGSVLAKEPVYLVGTWRGDLQVISSSGGGFYEDALVLVITDQQGSLFRGDIINENSDLGRYFTGAISGKKISIITNGSFLISGRINRTGTEISFVFHHIGGGYFPTGMGVMVKD